ncbi:MAG TPA: aspartate aminotransferase family protein [Rectinemataceae bacterium]|nr:aspartate aminotransferase family protein [Rectinemataceae bacterium]
MSDFFMDTYKRTGLVFVRGSGARLWDERGREYIDFTAGIGVNSLGHAHPALVAAITAQASRLIHISNYYQSREAISLAEKLCTATGFDRVFLCNSGAEANEGAIKIARKWGASKSPSRTTIVTLEGSFHGRTIATLKATGQSKFHVNFGPFPAGFSYVKANDAAALAAALGSEVCALMLEPIQGEGGVVPLDEAYLREAARLCAERGILLIADEVQCGMGRTGALLASAQMGIEADVVPLAKGLGGGVPIGAVLARGSAAEVLGRGDHGSTFGGNPLAAAAAVAVLDALAAPGFLGAVAAKGERLMAAVRSWKHPVVKEVRGKGLMIGIAVNVKPDRIKELCLERGLLVLTAGEDAVRLLPPLVIPESDIDAGLALMREAFDAVLAESRAS